jgi:hypothetical protein
MATLFMYVSPSDPIAVRARRLERRELLLCRAVNNLYRRGDSYRGREASRRLDATRVALYGGRS